MGFLAGDRDNFYTRNEQSGTDKEKIMVAAIADIDEDRYARCIDVSKRVRWEIEDVIKGRVLDVDQKFLPDGLSLVNELEILTADEQRFLSQVQGRTYACIFGLVERFINAKILEVSQDHWFGDQTKLEALVRFSDEELKHQALFRKMEDLATAVMPAGYELTADANDVAHAVLGKSTWAVLALTCHIEIFTQVHYKKSIEPAGDLSALWKDVFLFHWKEECQHAILDELEWQREDAKMSTEERDTAVADLIDLVVAVDSILQAQSAADARYFCGASERTFTEDDRKTIEAGILRAYRWQYIVSGIQDGRFMGMLIGMINDRQAEKITTALGPLLQ